MRLRIGEALVKPPCGLPAERFARTQHVKGVQIRVVNVYLGRNAAGAQPLDILTVSA